MKRNIQLLVVVAAGLVALGCAVTWRWWHTPEHVEEQASGLPSFRIAVLTPATHPSLEKIEQGFRQTLAQSTQATYKYTVFNANGDRVLMRAQAEEAVQGGFDLVFAIATQPAQLARELIAKKQLPIKFVFAAVNNPVKSGIVDSLEKPGPYGSGAVEVEDYGQQLTLLRSLRPDAKNIMLVYNPSQGAGLSAHKDKIESLCAEMGMTLLPVEVYQVHEIYTRARTRIADADVVMVLKDNLVVSAIDVLVKLCNTYGVTLLASDLDSSARGAAICFGVPELVYGKEAAGMAQKILEQGVSPADLPCLVVDQFQLLLNKEVAQAQKVTLPADHDTYGHAALLEGVVQK